MIELSSLQCTNMTAPVGVCAGNWFRKYHHLYGIREVYDTNAINIINSENYTVKDLDNIFS